ncbi:MAG: hypothetical protein ACHQF0_00975 [Chitinophagales bacterium]
MDNSTQQTELIMLYLDGEMNTREKDDFENRLASDESMQQELEDLKTARDAVKLFALKQQVAAVRGRMQEEIKPQAIVRKMSTARRIVKYSLATAASVLLIAICVLAYNFFSLSPDKLYNEKYNSFELSTLRGDNETPVTDVEKAYRQKDYKKVLDLSTTWTETSIRDEFLTAISYLELNKPSEAINLFNGVLELDQKSTHPVYRDEAEYYLALSYLKTRSYDKALELMNAIHDSPSHLYHAKFTKGFIRKVRMLKMR